MIKWFFPNRVFQPIFNVNVASFAANSTSEVGVGVATSVTKHKDPGKDERKMEKPPNGGLVRKKIETPKLFNS